MKLYLTLQSYTYMNNKFEQTKKIRLGVSGNRVKESIVFL